MKPETKHMLELFEKQKEAEVNCYKYSETRELMLYYGPTVSLGGTIVVSLIGMLVTFICSFIDVNVSGKISIVFSYITLIFALSIPIEFLAYQYFDRNADKWLIKKKNIDKQIEYFRKATD